MDMVIEEARRALLEGKPSGVVKLKERVSQAMDDKLGNVIEYQATVTFEVSRLGRKAMDQDNKTKMFFDIHEILYREVYEMAKELLSNAASIEEHKAFAKVINGLDEITGMS